MKMAIMKIKAIMEIKKERKIGKEQKEEREKKGRRPRLCRWPIFVSLILIFFLIFVFLALFLIVSSQWFSSWMLDKVNHKLERDFSIKVEAERLKFNLWRAKLEAEKVKVWPCQSNGSRNGNIRPLEPLLFLEEISINLVLSPLIKRQLHFQEIRIKSPSLDLTYFDGLKRQTQVFRKEPESKKEKMERGGWRFRVDHFLLENGHLARADFGKIGHLSLEKIEVAINFNSARELYLGELFLSKGNIIFLNKPELSFSPLRLNFQFNEKEASLDQLTLQGDGFVIEGEARFLFRPQFFLKDAQFSGEIDFSEISFFKNYNAPELKDRISFPYSVVYSGKINFSLNAFGNEEGLRGEMQLVGSDLFLGWPQPGIAERPIDHSSLSFGSRSSFPPALSSSFYFKIGKNNRANSKNLVLLPLAPLQGSISFQLPWLKGQPDLNGLRVGFFLEWKEKIRVKAGWPEMNVAETFSHSLRESREKFSQGNYEKIRKEAEKEATGLRIISEDNLGDNVTLSEQKILSEGQRAGRNSWAETNQSVGIDKRIEIDQRQGIDQRKMMSKIGDRSEKNGKKIIDKREDLDKKEGLELRRDLSSWPSLKGELKGEIKGKEIELALLAFDLAGLNFYLSGIYSASKNLQAKFELKANDLEKSFNLLKPYFFYSTPQKIISLAEKESLEHKKSSSRKEIIFGQLFAQGSLSGIWPEISGRFHLEASKFGSALWPAGNLEARAELEEKKINISQLIFVSSALKFSASGFISLTPKAESFRRKKDLDLNFELNISNLEELAQSPVLNQLLKEKTRGLDPLAGSFSATASVSGELKRPELSFKIEGKEFTAGGESLASLEGKGEFKHQLFAISQLQLKKTPQSPPIEAYLKYDLNKRLLKASVMALPQNLTDFSSLQTQFPLRGQMGFHVEIRGEKERFELIYKINGHNLESAYFSLPGLLATGKALFKSGKLEAATLSASFQPTPFTFYSLAVESLDSLEIRLQDGFVSISGLNLKGKNFSFHLEGALGLEKPKGEVVLKAQLPLEIINDFLEPEAREAFTAEGEVIINGRIGGTLKQLNPDVTIRMSNGFLSSASFSSPLEKIKLLACLRPDSFDLEELSFRVGPGAVLAKGQLPIENSQNESNRENENNRLKSESDRGDGNNHKGYRNAKKDIDKARGDETGKNREGQKNKEDLAGKRGEFNLIFIHLNPFDFLGNSLRRLPADFKKKIDHEEFSAETSGEIKLNFPPLPLASLTGKRNKILFNPQNSNSQSKNITKNQSYSALNLEKDGLPLSVEEKRASFNLEKNGISLLPPHFKIGDSAKVQNGRFTQFQGQRNLNSQVSSSPGNKESRFSDLVNDWLSGLQGEGRIDTLKFKLGEITLSNDQPLIFRLEPDILTLEEATLKSEFFQIILGGSIKNFLVIEYPRKLQTNFYIQATGSLEPISAWLEGIELRGKTSLNFRFSGTPHSLQSRGSIEIRGVFLELASWPFRLSDTTGYFFFDDRRLEVQSFRGLVNGAPWEIGGFIQLDDQGQMSSGRIQIEAREIPLEMEGLGGGLISLALRLEPRKPGRLLSGEIKLKKAAITADLDPLSRLLRRRTLLPGRSGQPSTPSSLQDLALEVRLNLEEPIAISNSFLQANLQGALTLSGSLTQPFLLGRLINSATGEFIWAERRYRLEKMQLDFTGLFPPDPRLEIVAQTELFHRYDELSVRLNLSGPASELRFSVQSSPPRSQEELAFLLLTGKSLEEIRREGLGALREQLLLALATPTASRLGGAMRRLFGVEEVRLEPLGIAGETDPGARLTLVKQITPAAKITSSVDITDSQRQSWNLDYRLTKGMLLQAFRLDDGSYGAGLRHSFSLDVAKNFGAATGEKKRLVEEERRLIFSLKIEGNLGFSEAEIRRKLKRLHPGKTFISSILNKEIKSLESFYRENKYLQARIEPKIDAVEAGQVEIVLEIQAGPKIELNFEGVSISKSLRRRIERIWTQEVSLERAALRSARQLEKYLKAKGYFRAEVIFNLKEYDLKERELKRVSVNFRINQGPRYQIKEIIIEGAREGREEELRRAIKSWRTEEAKGPRLFLIESAAVLEAVRNFYEERGFLEARVSAEIKEQERQKLLFVHLKIEEGKLSRVAEIIILGNQAVENAVLESLVGSKPGKPLNPNLLSSDRNNLLAFYRARGFREAKVAVRVETVSDSPDVRLIYQITEGRPYEIAAVEFSGIKESRLKKLAEIFGLKAGEPLSLEKISQGEKALYDTGDFSLVQVMTEPESREPGRQRVHVEVQLEPVLNARYGLRYNSEEKTEVTAGLDFRHLFGLGRHGLLHYLQNARERDFRFSFHDRSFLGLKVESLFSFYLTRRKEASFTTDEAGASWRHQFALPGKIVLSTVLRRSRIHTYEAEPTGPFAFDISLSLTELSLQAVRDTRDDPLDARTGNFFSSSLTYSPAALKSELTYLSWFGQATFYQPVGERLVFASNFRLGLATAFEQVMVPARRFYAGGGYSIRGFKQDMVGPYDPYLERPEGGEAVFISNLEARWRLLPGLDGVLFYDAGNVFPEVRDLRLRQLRHSLGLGLRLRSPVGLLRFDLGFNLKPKFGEPKQVFFFSLGPPF